MKKILAGTTALVALTLVGGNAFAADKIALSLGGKQEVYFGGIGSFDDGNVKDGDGLGMDTDTEVYVTGSTKLDNGIAIKAMIQMEAEANRNGARNVDEQWIEASGAFGALRLGEKEGVMDRFAVRAPLADDYLGYFSMVNAADWLKTPLTSTGGSTANYFAALDTRPADDTLRVTYVTPAFWGVQAGVSYAPNRDITRSNLSTPGSASGATGVPTGETGRDEVQVGLALNKEFSGVKVFADGSFSTLVDDGDEWLYRGGLGVNYAGFTLSGSYMGRSGEDVPNGSATNPGEYSIWEAGLHYATGPYGVGFSYAQNDAESGASRTVYNLGGTYTMGPGINVIGHVFYADNTVERSGAKDWSRDGIGAVTGLVLAF
ncbi:porin [Pararhodospirillum photometricum]|nr:porin [Pararhodospirillum photometricum]